MAGDKKHVRRPPSPGLAEAVVDGIQDPDLVQIRRDQICNAALELFLEKGFASTTIRDICARSGVNQASLYDYVANKHDILRRLLNRLWFRADVPTLPERLDRDGDAPLEDIVADYLRELWGAKRLGILLSYRAVPHLQDEDRRALHERERRLLTDLAAQLRRRKNLAEDDPRVEIVSNLIIFNTAFGPMRDWLLKGVNEEVLLRTVAASIVAMVDRLAAEPAGAPTEA